LYSDLFLISSLMTELSPLTDSTAAGVNAKIATAFNNWTDGQRDRVIRK
jgi:hypothetical protein